MTIRRYAALALCFSVLTAGSAVAKTVRQAHQPRVTRSIAAMSIMPRASMIIVPQASVREEFRDGSPRRWYRDGRIDQGDYRDHREGMVVENLRTVISPAASAMAQWRCPSFVDGYRSNALLRRQFPPHGAGAGPVWRTAPRISRPLPLRPNFSGEARCAALWRQGDARPPQPEWSRHRSRGRRSRSPRAR